MPSKGFKFLSEYLLPNLDMETFGSRLQWTNRDRKIFQVQWSHKSASDWTEKDAQVFIGWDKKKDRYTPEIKDYYSKSKQRFRAILYKLIAREHVTEIRSVDKSTKLYCIGDGIDLPQGFRKAKTTLKKNYENDSTEGTMRERENVQCKPPCNFMEDIVDSDDLLSGSSLDASLPFDLIPCVPPDPLPFGSHPIKREPDDDPPTDQSDGSDLQGYGDTKPRRDDILHVVVYRILPENMKKETDDTEVRDPLRVPSNSDSYHLNNSCFSWKDSGNWSEETSFDEDTNTEARDPFRVPSNQYSYHLNNSCFSWKDSGNWSEESSFDISENSSLFSRC